MREMATRLGVKSPADLREIGNYIEMF